MRKLLLVVPLVAACSEGPTGPNVKVQVSPLELPGVGRVCYDLAVENMQLFSRTVLPRLQALDVGSQVGLALAA